MHYIRCILLLCCGAMLTGCTSPLSAQRVEDNVQRIDQSGIQQGRISLCYVDRTGGLAGKAEHYSVGEDGEVKVVINEELVGTMQATPEQLAALQRAVTSDAWQQLGEEYGQPVPDGFTYDIHCGGTQLVVHDGAERPALVNNVIQQLDMLRQQAVEQ
jgi:hypothetical protein